MTPGERNQAIKDLRRAANRVLNEMGRLETCWRAFPENYRDNLPTPSPAEIEAICDRMDRDQLEDERFARALKK